MILGTPVSADESRHWIGQTLHDTFSTHFPQHTDDLVVAYQAWNEANLERLVQRYEGMVDLFVALQDAGVATGVVTSKRRLPALATLGHVGLLDRVPVLTANEDTARHKPSPDPLLHALHVIGRRPDESVYVGDATFDLRCAAAAGMDAVGVTWGAGSAGALRAEEPYAVVDDVAALQAVLLG